MLVDCDQRNLHVDRSTPDVRSKGARWYHQRSTKIVAYNSASKWLLDRREAGEERQSKWLNILGHSTRLADVIVGTRRIAVFIVCAVTTIQG